MRWKISYSPHAAGTDRGDPRDAGEVYACQVFPPLFFQQEGAAILQPLYFESGHPTRSRRNSRGSFSNLCALSDAAARNHCFLPV